MGLHFFHRLLVTWQLNASTSTHLSYDPHTYNPLVTTSTEALWYNPQTYKSSSEVVGYNLDKVAIVNFLYKISAPTRQHKMQMQEPIQFIAVSRLRLITYLPELKWIGHLKRCVESNILQEEYRMPTSPKSNSSSWKKSLKSPNSERSILMSITTPSSSQPQGRPTWPFAPCTFSLTSLPAWEETSIISERGRLDTWLHKGSRLLWCPYIHVQSTLWLCYCL